MRILLSLAIVPLLVLVPLGPASATPFPVCGGVATNSSCVGAYVATSPTYVCVGVYSTATGHCSGVQLP